MINVSKLAKPITKRNTQDDWSVKWPWHVYNKETATITCSWCIEYMEELSAEELSRYKGAGGQAGLSAFLVGESCQI